MSIKRIDFAQIDAKEQDIIEITGFPRTFKNVELELKMQVEYLNGIKELQKQIEIKYFSQLEQTGENISFEDEDEVNYEFWNENNDDSLDNLYYT